MQLAASVNQSIFRAPDAVAVALVALCCHWHKPEDCIIAAVHYGGGCQ
jgi:ADP-ribosylglycohydrolase